MKTLSIMTVYPHSDRQQPPTLWWKWKCPSLSRVQLFAVPWTVARQTPLSMRLLQARILEWITILFSGGSSPPRDWTQVSCIADSLHKSDYSNINWMRPMEGRVLWTWWVYMVGLSQMIHQEPLDHVSYYCLEWKCSCTFYSKETAKNLL